MATSTISKKDTITVERDQYDVLRNFYREYNSRTMLLKLHQVEADFLAGRTKKVTPKQFLAKIEKLKIHLITDLKLINSMVHCATTTPFPSIGKIA